MGKFVLFLITLIILMVALLLGGLFFDKASQIPTIKDGWFGRGKKKPVDESVVPFTVNITDDVLKDLQTRLENVRLSEDLENVKFQYGFQVSFIIKLHIIYM